MMKFVRYAFGLFALAALAAGAVALWILFYEPDRSDYPVRGIDVSHHQGIIDWARVAADDVAFAFIKASEGGDHRDTRFPINWREARAAGIKVGAYHFFTFCRPGRDQARNFIDALGRHADTLPAALDLEFGGNCAAKPTPDAIRTEIDHFLEAVEAHTGQPVVLYVTPEFFDAYKHILPERPLWVRSLFDMPDQADWAFWQYHNAGRVDGIRGRVDLNVVRDPTFVTGTPSP